VTRHDWRVNALCVNLSPEEADELFFFGPGKTAKRAKVFCLSCPVKRECQDYAILYGEVGAWAGMTDAERNAIAPLLRSSLEQRAIAEGTLETRDLSVFIQQIAAPYPLELEDEPTLMQMAVQ
jgi:hypothetical protein